MYVECWEAMKRQAVEGHGRDHGAEHDVLDGRLGRALVLSADGNERVEAVGGQLQGQIQGDELGGRGQEHEPPGRQAEHHEVVGALLGFQGRLALGVDHGHAEAEADGQLEELGQGVHPVGLGEKRPLGAELGGGNSHADIAATGSSGTRIVAAPNRACSKQRGNSRSWKFRASRDRGSPALPFREGTRRPPRRRRPWGRFKLHALGQGHILAVPSPVLVLHGGKHGLDGGADLEQGGQARIRCRRPEGQGSR